MPRIRQSVTGSSFVTGSGFIVRSPRILLNELDDNPGSYPTVRRTGDPTRSGTKTVSFNDGTTIDFVSNGSPVFPMMLPRNSSFITQSVDIIGEQSDISIAAPIRSFQQPAHLHYSPVEEMGPFNENRATPATDFYLSGTDPDILPGFASPVRSKIAIEIDITPQSDAMVMRNVRRRNVSENQPISDDNTGFLYYNFSRRVWEQIGSIDPATGTPLYYDYSYDGSLSSNRTGSFPSQFTWTPGLATAGSASFGDVRESTGYSKIGSPTAIMGAPSLPKYHATSSQALKLSNFIKSPILLEKISVSFEEVNAQRVNGGVPPAPAVVDPNFFKSGSIRDIDNYSFFVYRQRRANQQIDSVNDVSGSSRYLIASSSMTFWNSLSLSGSALLHSPTFSHDFNMTCNDTYAVGSFTGSISLDFYPAVCGPQFLGFSAIIDDDGVSTSVANNAWPGSTSIANYPDDLGVGVPTVYGSDESVSSFSSRMSKLDSRPARKFGGEIAGTRTSSIFGLNLKISTGTPQSNISPYLLMPDDELIFGVEAGVGPVYRAGNFSHITGSFLRITDKPCKITLYGSMIQNDSEHLHSLNQDLTSDSVHEIVGAEPVLDRFQIEPVSSYYGSYLDGIITGSMLTPLSDGLLFVTQSEDNSRRVISRVSLGQAGVTGSLQRFERYADAGEVVYDSCLPDYFDIISIATVESEYQYRGNAVLRYPGDAELIYETGLNFDSAVKQFPFEGNPARRTQKDAALVSIANSGGTDVLSDPVDLTGKTLDSLRTVFLTRYAFNSKSPGIVKPNYKEAFIPTTDPGALSYDLSTSLVSSYFFTGSDDGVLYDLSGKYNHLDLTPRPDSAGSTHPAPSESADVPVSGLLKDGSLYFAPAALDINVSYAAATSSLTDHRMTNGVVDSAFTLSITFKSDSSSTEMVLIERSVPSTSTPFNSEYKVWLDSSGFIHFRIYDNGNSTYKGARTTTFPISTSWTNVTVTYDGDQTKTTSSGMNIYINGTLRNKINESSGHTGTAMYNALGSRTLVAAGKKVGSWEPDETKEFNGYIHALHIWKGRALTSSEATALSRAELSGISNGVIKHRADFGLAKYDGPIRQGTYRYGISNINQETSSFVFLPGHFGFARDVLEQRKDTAFAGSIPPITCKFISGSLSVDPSSTHSQNVSTFATSSLPYFDDGTARNRSDNPDDDLII